MEYVQERIATLHDFHGADPPAPTDRTAVVVPMTEREHASLAAERVLSTLAEVQPTSVIVPLRASPDRIEEITTWLRSFDLPLAVLWCSAPALESMLAEADLDGLRGKGRDIWLAMGVAAERAEYLLLQDADAKNFDRATVSRLLFPLSEGFTFSKGYYARIEKGRLYGRLFRLLYTPLVRTLADHYDDQVLEYLRSFRYALSGEVAMTAEFAREAPVPRDWGLEVGMLGAAYAEAGFAGTAQVDLGFHEHDHRSVGGPNGLGDMAEAVAGTLLSIVEGEGVNPAYDTLPDRYRETAITYLDRYGTDAAFNDLDYDRNSEREQIDIYADAITSSAEDDRLPAWAQAPIEPAQVEAVARPPNEGAQS